jgi:hypothetical protein
MVLVLKKCDALPDVPNTCTAAIMQYTADERLIIRYQLKMADIQHSPTN